MKKSLGASPVLRKDSSDNGYIMGTSLEMAIQSDEDFELIGFYSADNRKHKVSLKKNGQVIWSGYVLPEQYQEPYIAPPYDVIVTASDGLGILKNIDFDLIGKHSFLAIIKHCVDKLDLDFGFIIASDLWETRMSRTVTGLLQANIDVFIYEGKSCYEVLDNILSDIDACITQINGNWFVGRFTDMNKPYEYYDQDLTKIKTENVVVSEMGQVGDDCYPINNLELDIQSAVKDLTVKKDYKFYPSFLQNYRFENGNTGWTYSVDNKDWISVREPSDQCFLQIKRGKTDDHAIQSIYVERTNEAILLQFKYNVSSREGILPYEYKVKVNIFIVSGDMVWYLTPKGWQQNAGSVYLEGISVRQGTTAWKNWLEYELKADGFPVSGQLTIELYGDNNQHLPDNNYTGMYYREVVLRTIPDFGGVELTGLLNSRASKNGDDVILSFGDRPVDPNNDKKYANNITLSGGEISSSWQVGSGTGDSYIKILMRSLASRFGIPYKVLTGIIQGENIHFGSIIHHSYNNTYYYIKEGEYDLLEDEMSVTLLELPVYNTFPFTMTDTSIRTSSSTSDEHRSVNGKDYRVFTPDGLGVPKRIIDLQYSQFVELTSSHVLEIDVKGSTGSKQIDLASLKSYFTDDIDFSSLAKLVGDNTFLGKQTINGDIYLAGNIFQNGSNYETHAEHVFVKDEFVNLRDGVTVAIGPGMLSGFNIAKYNGTDNLLLGAGNDGVARVGHQGGELQALLTREDSPARGLLWYDEVTKKAMGCGILTSDLHLANWDEAFENMGKIYSTSYGSYYDFSVAAGGIDYAASATYIRVQGNDGRYYNPRTMEADNSMLLQGHNASYFAKRNGDAGENFNMSIAQCFYEDGAKRTVINEGKIYNIAADGSVAHSLYLNLGKTIVAHHNGTIQAPIGQFGNILIHNNNEINTDATGFWLNYRNGDGSVTNYKSLIIGNGKNNSIATFYGESKLAKFYGDIQSDNYATNAGFKLTQAGYGELQHLRVNGSFTCVDLIAEKKRAVNGGLRICKASGKIKEVHRENDTSTLWIVTLENENQFAVNDWVICQYYNGGNSNRYYRAKVVWVDSQNRYFALSDFNDETRPADGDDIIADNGHYIDLVSTENGEQRQYITFVNNNHNYLHLGKLNTYGLGGDAYGIASKDTSGNTIFQLGSTNQITGFNFTSKYLNKGTGSSSNDFGLIISTENVLEDTSGIIYNHCRKLAGYSLTWHKDSNAGHIVMGQLASNANTLKAGFMGIQMMNHLGQEFFALSAKTDKVGATEYYCKIAGCNYNHKNIWTDGWKLMYDGSGNLAKGNISWDINGNVTFTENVKMQWQTGVVHDAQFEYGLDYWGTGWEGLLLPKLTKGNVNPNNNVYSTPARQVDMYSRKPVPVDVNKTYKMRIRVKTNNVAAMGRMYAGGSNFGR